MHVRQRLQELGPRVTELRPLVGKRGIDLEARRVDDRLGLVRVDRADRVDDGPSRPDTLSRGAEELELELGERLGAPAEVRPLVQDP